ncbi:DUF2231 domain-containing protein [Chitinimonas lacunae]|uniref:DUF2231 domain-containing protein n=1 Tax=Chitinimonas lacunae TaxID=1963018 RepID=A0ABV8MR89_9NEIS
MKSKARLFGHPIHQMLIVFPLGLLATAVVFDLVYLFTEWTQVNIAAYWVLSAGLIGVLVAAPFGLIDWLAIPAGTRAKRIGLLHGGGNLVVGALFLLSWWLREPLLSPSTLALVLSFGGAGLALFTAWLGGELVARLGVGVYEDAGLNASSSLHLE